MPARPPCLINEDASLHDFGNNFYNFVSFNSHGRLVALGGFGNLRGTLDIFDRRSLTKVTTIDAANASFCQWSPDGRFNPHRNPLPPSSCGQWHQNLALYRWLNAR